MCRCIETRYENVCRHVATIDVCRHVIVNSWECVYVCMTRSSLARHSFASTRTSAIHDMSFYGVKHLARIFEGCCGCTKRYGWVGWGVGMWLAPCEKCDRKWTRYDHIRSGECCRVVYINKLSIKYEYIMLMLVMIDLINFPSQCSMERMKILRCIKN